MSVHECDRKFADGSPYDLTKRLRDNVIKDLNDVESSEKFYEYAICREQYYYLKGLLENDFSIMLRYISIAKNVSITKKIPEDIYIFKLKNVYSAIGMIDKIFADINHLVYLHPKAINRIDHYKLHELVDIKNSLFTWKNNIINKRKH